MKQNIYLIWLIILISQQQTYADSWTQKADFGGIGRYYSVGFSIGAKGYIGTGNDGTNFKKDFWEFDPAANVWTQKADFGGEARSGSVGFSIGSKGYIGTGEDSNYYYGSFWEYNPATNVWTQKSNITFRTQAIGFSIGTKGYIGTGYTGAYKKDFWEFDPTNNVWTQKADFGGTARMNAIGFSISSKGYIGTGWDGAYKKDFWEYNPSTNAWVQKADFGGTARYGAVGFSISSKGYIGTGGDGYTQKDFWEYDPSTNTWIQKIDVGGTYRYLAVGFSIGTKGYIGTGWDGSYSKKFYEYNPACTLTASITPSIYQSTCAGSTLAFTGSSTGGTSPTYVWSSSPIGFSSSEQNPSFTTPPVTQSTNYTLTLTATEGACTATATTMVTVNPIPTVNTASNQNFTASGATTAINFSGSVPNTTYSWTNSNPGIGLAASGTGDIPVFTAINTGTTPQVGTITVTPITNGYAYVANVGSNSVSLVNTTTNVVMKTINVGTRPSALVVSPDGSRVYVANLSDNTVSVINTFTNTVIATVGVGSYPESICLNPDGSRVYTANTLANSVSVINTSTNTLITTFSAGNVPENIIISANGNWLYLSNSNSSTVSVINTLTNSVVGTITVGARPEGMVLSSDNSKLYVVNYDANTVSVINTGTYGLITTINVGTQPFTIKLNKEGSKLYVLNRGSNTISVINTANNTISNTITLASGSSPTGASFNTEGTNLYVTNYGLNTVSVINTSTNAVTSTIAVGTNPSSLGNFTTGLNCVGTAKTFTITVNPSAIFVDAIPNQFCVNTPFNVPFTIVGTFGSGNIFTVQLSNSAGNFSSPTSIGTLTSTTAGTISATIPSGTTPGGNYQIRVVSSSPSIASASTSVMIPPSSVGKTICAGNTVNLSATGCTGTFAWYDSNSGTTILANTANYTSPILNTSTTYYVSCTQNSCESSRTAVLVTVNPTPTVTVNNQAICLGDNTTLTASGCTGAVTWNTGASGSVLSLINVTTSGTYTATCTLGSCAATSTGTVTVSPTPTVTINTQTICLGNNTTLTASGCTGTVTWNTGASGSVLSLTNVTATGTYAATCTLGSCTTTGTGTVSVNPTPTITVNTQTICLGDNTTLTASGCAGTITWNTGASGSVLSLINVTTSGTYTATCTLGSCVAASTGTVSVPTVNTISNQSVTAGGATTAINFSGSVPNTTYSWTNSNPGIGLAASGIGDIPVFTAINTGTTPQVGTITVTPITNGYAYVANVGSNTVSLVNTTTNTVVKTINVGTRPSGLVVSPDGSRVYVANLNDNSVSVINTFTNTVMATVVVGAYPESICISPDGSRVYTANTLANSVSVINTSTNTLITTISAGNVPENIIVSANGNLIYLSNSTSGTVSVINTATYSIVGTITAGARPEGMALSADNSKLYVVNYDANTVSVINTSTYGLITTINVGTQPFTIKLNKDGSKLYVLNKGSNTISVINTANNTIANTITLAVGSIPNGASFNTEGTNLYVTNYGLNTVSVINTSTNAVTSTIAVGTNPSSLGNFTTGFNCSGTAKTFTISVAPSGPATITQMEYFIDADPGYGSGTAVSFTAGNPVTVNFPVSLTASADGFHFLSLRAKDANNQWGIVAVRPFYKESMPAGALPTITAMEYFIDNDLGYGNGTPITGFTAGTTVSKSFTISLGSLSNGSHQLFIRGKDANNKWSIVGIRPFTVQDNMIIVDSIPPQWCVNTAFNVPFTITGTYTAGNIFTAQLSDINGSFASPAAIGTFSGTATGVITATVPTGTPLGNNYQIRVVSSTPSITNTDSKPFQLISVCPPICAGLLTLAHPADDILSGNIIKQASATNGTISASNYVQGNGTRATYQAKSITLTAGFKADNGVVFKVETGGCNN